MHDDDRKYEIGFGKPPHYTRFKKGQPSPNPRGRPRKARPATVLSPSEYDRILREVLNQPVSVRDAKGTRTITRQEALIQQKLNMALSGNVLAINAVTREARELELREAETARLKAEERRESLKRAVRFQAERRRIWDAAKRQGREPEDPWPHPDDIMIDADNCSWHIRGPFWPKDEPFFEWVRACRDVNFTRASLAVRRRPLLESLYLFWDMAWRAMDRHLPLRWQIAPVYDRACLADDCKSTRKLRAFADDRARDALRLENALGMRRSREAYRIVNNAMRPALLGMGYRSLAELEQSLVSAAKT